METFGIASVAVITVITYLVGLVGKASSMNDKWIPILCGVCGFGLRGTCGAGKNHHAGKQHCDHLFHGLFLLVGLA